MKTLRIFTVFLAAALSTTAAVAQSSQKITAGKANEYGLVYSLPLTVVDIYIEAELTEQHPGEFHNFAKRYLGTDDAIQQDSYSAKILNAIIVPRGIASDANRQLAQFKASPTAAFINLTPDNIPLGINTEEAYTPALPTLPVAKPASKSPLDSEGAKQAITADMARSSSISKKAELAAQRIFELREIRTDILSGNTDNPPADGTAMGLVLDNLSAQESALTAMFLGVSSKRTVVKKITVEPDTAAVQIVARLSAIDGIVDADNLAGAPISIQFDVLEKGSIPLTEEGIEKTYPKGGVAYCIPGTALVSVSYAGRVIANADVPLAQLGIVFGLNPSLFTDRKAPYKVVFDPTTGAVVELSPIE